MITTSDPIHVLVTGGAGFAARALYRRAEREGWAWRFTAFSRDDAKHAALQARFPHVRTVRGDVRSHIAHLSGVMAGHDLVIHMAANKYVDRSEFSVFDTISVNVEGSRNVALAAMAARVRHVVGLSTDKACEPANVYGMTKALMERLFLEADRAAVPNHPAYTRFSLVRYGNVVGSTGSVATLFEKMAAQGGPVRITDPTMTRFWMAADEAVSAILRSLELPGSVFIPAMSAMTIADVAAAVAPGVEAEIVGPRPGEKHDEYLLSEPERTRSRASHFGGVVLREQAEGGTPYPSTICSADPPLGFMSPTEFAAVYVDARTI